MGWGGGRSWVSRMRTPAPPPRPAEDGLLRCKQLTVLLDWAEQFEAESRQSDEAVAFSVLLGDLNFDNCSLGKTARSPPPHTHTLRARAHTHTHTLTYTHTRTNTHTHMHNGILLSRKKECNNVIYSNMDGPRDYHT